MTDINAIFGDMLTPTSHTSTPSVGSSHAMNALNSDNYIDYLNVTVPVAEAAIRSIVDTADSNTPDAIEAYTDAMDSLVGDMLNELDVTPTPHEEIEAESEQESSEVPEQERPRNGIMTVDDAIAETAVSQTTSRFRGASWAEEIQNQDILIAGMGGIGSWTAFNLSRVNPRSLTLVDPDTIEAANMSGQLYGFSQVGQLKVHALAYTIREYSNYYSVTGIPSRIQDVDTSNTKIFICGFDNMTARKAAFEIWLRKVNATPAEERKNYLFVDGRLALEYLEVYCIPGDNSERITRYKNEDLFEQSDAEQVSCSMKQTTYMAMMIGSTITNVVVNYVNNLHTTEDSLPRDLPYLTKYDAEQMFYETDNAV